MHSTPESEAAEIAAAHVELEQVRHDLALAHRNVTDARAPLLSGLDDKERALMSLEERALRRERAAWRAHAAGDRRRDRQIRWGRLFGARPALPLPPTSRAAVHAATVTFLDAQGAHDSTEDMHPARLDAAEAALDGALTDRHREAGP